MSNRWLLAATFCLALAFSTHSMAQEPTDSPAVVEARALLDSWEWNEKPLVEAYALITQALQQNPEDPAALLELARYHIMKTGGGNERALEVIDQIMKIDPSYSEAYVLKAHLLTNYGQYDAAVDLLMEARRLNSSSAWWELNFARIKQLRGDLQTAATMCAAVLRRDPLNVKAKLSAYECRRPHLQRQRDWAALESDYKAVVAASPNNASELAQYAVFLCMTQGRCAEAKPLVDKAASLREDLRYIDYARGALLYDAWAQSVAKHGLESAQANAQFATAQAKIKDLDFVMVNYGSMARNEALVKALLAKGVSVHALDERFNNALMVATRRGDVEAMKVLLKHGADPNMLGNNTSPLMLAAREGYLDVVQLLLQSGADQRSRPREAILLTLPNHFAEVRAAIEAKFPQFAL